MSRPAPKLEAGAEVGRVARLKAQFDRGGKASNPADFERQRQGAATSARAQAALYNMQLRGAQVQASRKAAMGASASASTISTKATASSAAGSSKSAATDDDANKHVTFELHEFTDEWQEYPWHLAAVVDDDDAFWVPELALALEKDDERAINEAVLRFFFEEHDRDRLNEIDALLDANRGREELLFVELSQAYAGGGAAAAAAGAAEDAAGPGGAAATTTTATETAASSSDQPPPPPQVSERRRPSFIVSGVRRGSGWEMNAQDEELKSKMAEAGAAPDVIETVVSAAAAQEEQSAAPPSDAPSS